MEFIVYGEDKYFRKNRMMIVVISDIGEKYRLWGWVFYGVLILCVGGGRLGEVCTGKRYLSWN